VTPTFEETDAVLMWKKSTSGLVNCNAVNNRRLCSQKAFINKKKSVSCTGMTLKLKLLSCNLPRSRVGWTDGGTVQKEEEREIKKSKKKMTTE
jgi:hypothetical protein